MKPGDIIKVKLGHDIHEAELVKENAKTVLVKVLWTKTRYRKVKAIDGAGQANLFGERIPYTVRDMKIIKLPKVKIVNKKEHGPMVGEGWHKALVKAVKESEPPPTPAPQGTVREEALASKPDPFAELEAMIKTKGGE